MKAKRAKKTPRQELDAALNRFGWTLFNQLEDINARLARIDAGESRYSPLEAAGIVRVLHSHMEIALRVAEPVWSDVRALHRAWVAAMAWADAYAGAARGEKDGA